MNIIPLFIDSPLVVKIVISIVVLLPSLLGGSSLALHFKKDKKHSGCKLYPSLIERDKIKEDIKEIKDKIILSEQMNILSSANAKIMFIIRTAYLELTSNERDIDHYDKTLLQAKDEIKDNVRKWLRVNHYTQKTETEFNIYVEEKIQDMIDIVSYHLNKSHKNNHFEVTREDLYTHNKAKVIPNAVKLWTKAFSDFREIARDNEKKIEELNKKLEGFI